MSKKTEAQEKAEIEKEAIELSENTFMGDLMNIVLNQVKAIKKPWESLSENDQDSYLLSIEAQIRTAARKAIRIIMAQNSVIIPATVNKVVFKDGVTAELKLVAGSSGTHDLADAEGQVVSILIVRAEILEHSEGGPEADKDQPDLPLD